MKRGVIIGLVIVILLVCIGLAMRLPMDPVALFNLLHGK